MAGKDEDGPSLELPSLGFRRRRAKRPEKAPVEPVGQPDRGEQPTQVLPPTPQPPPRSPAEEDEAATGTGHQGFALPALGGLPASLVTGLVTGGVLVGLVWASLGACEVVRGTSTCGDAGFLLLLAALVVTGVVGQQLLRAFAVPDPGSTSILGTGLVTVISLLFLGEQLFAWWMVLAVPVVAAGAYALAHRVTTLGHVPSGGTRR